MRDPLDVWLYGIQVATITEDGVGRMHLDWSEAAVDRWGPGARVLSAKLTIDDRALPTLVQNYVDGLLPEGDARINHALSAGVAPDDTFALIRAYGRDTPGAAIFVPSGEPDPTRAGHYEPLTVDDLARRLREADAHSPASSAGVTDSSTLPGMVPKITVHRDGDQWFACKDGAPSTWIIKRASIGDVADVVDTEVASLALARRIGLTSIDAEVVDFGDVRGIAVSRYDRVDEDHTRLHQEDLAQAIGLNTRDPNRKVQWGSRMPSLRLAADVLRLDGANPDDLLRLAVFSHLIGNTDLHAKNISFLRYDDGRVGLTPAYDVAMHLHHPRDNRRSALDVNGKYLMSEIDIDDLVAEGVSWGLPRRRAGRVAARTVAELAEALDGIDRDQHPGVSDEAWDVVESRVRAVVDPDGRSEVVSPRPTDGLPTRSQTRRRGPRRPG